MAVCRQNKELGVGMKRDEKWRGGEEADICGAPAVRSFSFAAVIDLLLSAAEGAEGGGAGGGRGVEDLLVLTVELENRLGVEGFLASFSLNSGDSVQADI